MRTLELTDDYRRQHFDFFRRMSHPHFAVCAHLPVGSWVAETKARNLRMTPSLVYLLVRAANDIPQFRQRIRDETIVEHDRVHPSFTVETNVADMFSFCDVPFDPDLGTFLTVANANIEARRVSPSLAEDPDRDDRLFMSPLPWVIFTSVEHAMNYHPHDSVPRITWGKLYGRDDELLMPLSVQAHHALVDGIHMARYFERVEALAGDPEQVMGPLPKTP